MYYSFNLFYIYSWLYKSLPIRCRVLKEANCHCIYFEVIARVTMLTLILISYLLYTLITTHPWMTVFLFFYIPKKMSLILWLYPLHLYTREKNMNNYNKFYNTFYVALYLLSMKMYLYWMTTEFNNSERLKNSYSDISTSIKKRMEFYKYVGPNTSK